MQRRTLLRIAGAAGAAGLAGCLADATPDDGATPTPTPAPRSIEATEFRVTGRHLSGKPAAEVTFDGEAEQVRCIGTIEGADGCTTAALEDATYDRSSDELHLRVRTVDREGTADRVCTQALVYIDYEATVRFTGGVPSRATVSHDGRAIASAGHESASTNAIR